MSDGRDPYKTTDDLPEDARTALGHLLLTLADTKRILGLRYADWILGAPSVEAGIACSAMAQDEWGHARIVYAMLREFGHDPDALEHERSAEEYRSSELLDSASEGWPELIALNLLLDTAVSVVFEALGDSRYEPIHYKVSKLLDEERFHFEHARGWTRRLSETAAGREALNRAFGRALGPCLAWFGPDDDPETSLLSGHAILSRDSAGLRVRWNARVAPVIASAGLDLPDDPPSFEGWSQERRRAAAGGPDEDTLARARGDRNRALLAE